jgi:hypothetical protein
VGAVGIAESRHHPVLRQPHWREPATGVSECPSHAQHYRADRAQSDEQSGIGRYSRFEPEWFHIRVYPAFIGLLLMSSTGLPGPSTFANIANDCDGNVSRPSKVVATDGVY